MSQSVNKVLLIGFVGDAPETRFSQQGKPVTTFSVAVNENWKDAQGTKQERVEWFRIVCFGRLAEAAGQWLDKGKQLSKAFGNCFYRQQQFRERNGPGG